MSFKRGNDIKKALKVGVEIHEDCCKHHGCQLNDPNCPVVDGSVEMDGPCMVCRHEWEEDMRAQAWYDEQERLEELRSRNEQYYNTYMR